jgi:hypothetical protein
MQLLLEIITAHEGSLQAAALTSRPPQQQQTADASAASSTAAEAAAAEGAAAEDSSLEAVLAAVLDPLLEMVRRSAEVLSPDSPARLDDGGRLDPTAHKVRNHLIDDSNTETFETEVPVVVVLSRCSALTASPGWMMAAGWTQQHIRYVCFINIMSPIKP